MPPKGTKVYFKNYQKMLPVPFVIYADFEAITEKINPQQKSHTQILIRVTKLAVMDIKWFAIMMRNIQKR